jgi:amino acid adenylation domain-containing protein
VVIGTPIAGRTRGEVEGLVGFFVNTLALRGDLSGDPSFREVLKRVREACLGGYAHQDVPFERLVEELAPRRSLAHTPLFQVMFALQNAPQRVVSISQNEARPEGSSDELWLSAVEAGEDEGSGRTAKFELTLSMIEERAGLLATLEYSTDLFDRATVERMLRHFEHLLERVVVDAGGRLSELRLMGETEERQVVRGWNDTARAYTRGLTAVDLFEEQSARAPEAMAVVSAERQLSYGELNEQANHLAHHLRACGVGPDVVVATLLERSPDLIVALLAILKAGGAYLPLDPTHPPERLSFMLADSGAQLLITQERLRASASAWPNGRILCLDSDWPTATPHGAANPVRNVAEEHLAYVIYTSGSTGRPKGVAIPHRGLSNLIEWHRETYGVQAGDRATQVAGVGFDASVWEVWPCLTAGASLCIPVEEVRASPQRLQQWMVDERITISFVPTPVAEVLLTLEWPGEAVLRTLLTGGDRLLRRPPATLNFEVRNHYGPTETTVVATAARVAASGEGSGLPSIGRPIANTRVYILDAGLQPVPVGVAGELYIGGEGLARGYLHRPELTAERFIPSPFESADENGNGGSNGGNGSGNGGGGRMYRTGDRARYLSDGRIEFLGRVDHQVKVRGYRIELGEIEAALSAHAGVREAVVIVREEEAGDKRLVAYVVPGDETVRSQEIGKWRSFLKERLPEYMVPSAFVMLEQLPLTPNGKVDRRALPAPETAPLTGLELYVTPRNKEELQLAEIWEEVLPKQLVGMTDNFFDLGGHSMLAIQLFALIEERLHKKLPVAFLFQHGTIERLANLIRQRDPAPQSLLVKLQSGASGRRPLFLVHPVGGSVFCYVELARALGREQPLYAVQARGLNGEDVAPRTTIEEMSATYLKELRKVQPAGPYLLGGWSIGGVIAFEMAQQLRVAGEEVAMVAMFDSYSPTLFSPTHGTESELHMLARFAVDLGLNMESLTLPPEQFMQRSFSEQLSVILKLAVEANVLPVETGLAKLHDRFAVFKNNLRAIENYVPRAYEGRIALFAAREGAGESAGAARGWNGLAPQGVELHVVPGSHYTLLRQPQVQHLADKLKAALPEPGVSNTLPSPVSIN